MKKIVKLREKRISCVQTEAEPWGGRKHKRAQGFETMEMFPILRSRKNREIVYPKYSLYIIKIYPIYRNVAQ